MQIDLVQHKWIVNNANRKLYNANIKNTNVNYTILIDNLYHKNVLIRSNSATFDLP